MKLSNQLYASMFIPLVFLYLLSFVSFNIYHSKFVAEATKRPDANHAVALNLKTGVVYISTFADHVLTAHIAIMVILFLAGMISGYKGGYSKGRQWEWDDFKINKKQKSDSSKND
jgi:hypothetical protein